MPKQTSYGELYTMADDLIAAQMKKQVSASGSTDFPDALGSQKNIASQILQDQTYTNISEENPFQTQPRNATPSFGAVNRPPQKSVKELLPFEGEEEIAKKPLYPLDQPISPQPTPLGVQPTSRTQGVSAIPLQKDLLTKESFPKPMPPSPLVPGASRGLSGDTIGPTPFGPRPQTPPLSQPPTAPRMGVPLPPIPPVSRTIFPPKGLSPLGIEKPKRTKTLILVAFVVAGALIAGGTAYFLLGKRHITEEKKQQEEVKKVPPAAFVQPDFLLEVEAPDATETNLRTTLNDLVKSDYPANSITHIPLRIKDVVIDNKAQYVDTKTFFDGLHIARPDNLFDVVQQTFTLYLYRPTDQERVMCQNNLIAERSCYGPRLGIILKAQDGKKDLLAQLMNQWKKMVPGSGLDILTLNTLTRLPEGEPVYQLYTHQPEGTASTQAIEVSYINLPMSSYNDLQLPSTSVDMAVVNDLLIIATSKSATLSVIDKIIKQ